MGRGKLENICQFATYFESDEIDKLDLVAEQLHHVRSRLTREAVFIYLKTTEKEHPQIFNPHTFKSISDSRKDERLKARIKKDKSKACRELDAEEHIFNLDQKLYHDKEKNRIYQAKVKEFEEYKDTQVYKQYSIISEARLCT